MELSFGRRRTLHLETPGVHMSSPTEAPRPKAVLVGVQLPGVTDAEQRSSLKELKRLCETLGFEVVGEVTQKRKGLGAATLLGEGKLVELAAWTGGTGVVPKGPPGKKKATEEDEEEEEDETEPRTRGAARAHRGAARHRRGRRPRALASPAPPPRGRDLGRAGPRSHGRDHRDLPPARVEPPARLQVEIARLNYVAPRLRETGGGERQRGGIGQGARASPPWSSIAARSATASPSSRRSSPPSRTSRRRDGRSVRRRCASRWSATPTRASRR